MKPIDLLRDELNKWVKAKKKSEEAFTLKKITLEEHQTHIENIIPKIQEYKDAIQTLIIYGS